jgi:transcriptional regulator with XRE-family HTH domain
MKTNMKFYKEIGKAVLRLRKEKKSTQDKLADNAEIASGHLYIGRVEHGEVEISAEYLLRIANGLNLTLIEFLKEVDYNGVSE